MRARNLLTLIELAIDKEEEAYIFYQDLMNRTGDKSVKDTLFFIASEELKHKAFLIEYREGHYGLSALPMDSIVDYKLAEYLEKPDPEKEFDSKDVYLIAAHRELASYHFYTELADISPAGESKELLLRMAAEEMKHKEKVEYLYSNTAFPQTQGG